MAADPLENFLRSVQEIRHTGAGTDETAYYGSLESLLNEVGKTLKPKVRGFMGMRNLGAGMPDGGLFTADQFRKSADAEPQKGQPPERGAIEAKGVGESARHIAGKPQVGRYLERYGLVLVTTFREFLLVGQGDDGKPRELEFYSLCDDKRMFWLAAPRTLADKHADRFLGFLRRVLLHKAPLKEPQDLAWFLASYARDARYRLESQDMPALAAIRQALEEALGLRFEGAKGEHFFRSTLVQTLFYGVFSAWVLWHKERPGRKDKFHWHEAAWSLRVPMIATLFGQISQPDKLRPLGLEEVLDWAGDALNRVERPVFFEKFEEHHAVQYFYEPFLEAFDPELRKDLGVWYTPHEIVKYQVARVDTVLREELDIADGLADPRVVVLDPCCGTGAYLVEVLNRIGETLRAKGGDALVASDLKKAAKDRVFGFEILPAPFVIAHLQLGLTLQHFGAPLKPDRNERVGVYLTNALTGWEPPKEPKTFLFPEMKAEHDAAERVKREAKILVVIGNPPYNAFAGVSPEEEQGLVDPYKQGLREWGITKNYLDDFYVRFFRLAERRIAEMTGRGVVSFISNFSYLSDPSFVVMRQRFLAEFDRLWLDCMNGDSRETGKLTPDGKPDPSVFSTQYNREGIRVGTAIGVLVRKENRDQNAVVRFRHFWGVTKRQELLNTLTGKQFDAEYTAAEPSKENRYSFRPEEVSSAYRSWPRIPDLSANAPYLGLNENRGGALQAIDRERIASRMRAYLDKELPWEEYKSIEESLTQEAAGFAPESVRAKVQKAEPYSEGRITRYIRRPFDVVWAYLSDISPLWNRSRPELRTQLALGQPCLITRPGCPASPEGVPFYVTKLAGEQDAIRGHAYYFPLRLPDRQMSRKATGQGSFLDSQPNADLKANLSPVSRAYLAGVGINAPDSNAEAAGAIWMHALAVGYSPGYLAENADGIRQDWPRVPLPNSRTLLEASAAIGEQIAGLLDTETGVKGVTQDAIRVELKAVGILTGVSGHEFDADTDLDVTAGWGHAGKGGVTMPAKGKIATRDYEAQELDAIRRGAQALGLGFEQALDLLGRDTRDVYLNGVAYWKNIPANVWDYTIGSYQVIKKWLSYREKQLLGRALTSPEAREVMNIARRIAAIILLQPALDDNYRAVKDNAWAWPTRS